MTASTKIHSQTQMLHTCRMVVDSNSHHSMLNMHTLPDSPDSLISEALIPQVRTIATLIAAERHDFNQSSPNVLLMKRISSQRVFWFWAYAVSIWILPCCPCSKPPINAPKLSPNAITCPSLPLKCKCPYTPAALPTCWLSKPNTKCLHWAIWLPTAVHLQRNFPILFCKTTWKTGKWFNIRQTHSAEISAKTNFSQEKQWKNWLP